MVSAPGSVKFMKVESLSNVTFVLEVLPKKVISKRKENQFMKEISNSYGKRVVRDLQQNLTWKGTFHLFMNKSNLLNVTFVLKILPR